MEAETATLFPKTNKKHYIFQAFQDEIKNELISLATKLFCFMDSLPLANSN